MDVILFFAVNFHLVTTVALSPVQVPLESCGRQILKVKLGCQTELMFNCQEQLTE